MVKTEMVFKDNWTVRVLRFKLKTDSESVALVNHYAHYYSHELIINSYTLKGNNCCRLARLVGYLDFCKQDVLCSWTLTNFELSTPAL